MKNFRRFALTILVGPVLAAGTLLADVRAHSFDVVAGSETVCTDGAIYDGQTTAASSVGIPMTAEVWDATGTTLLGTGNTNTFTAVNETFTFTVPAALTVGATVVLSVTNTPGTPPIGGTEGDAITATVADCTLPMAPATPAWALALLLGLLLAAGSWILGKAPGASASSGRRRLISLLLPLVLVTGTVAKAQTIVIVKETVPGFQAQDFSFSGDLGDFDLDTDSDETLPSSETFTPLTPGTYVVTEAPVEGWLLTALGCADPTENSLTDVGAGTATIVLDGTETVTCTFQNSQGGKLIVDKQTQPVGDPTVFDFDLDEAQLEFSVQSPPIAFSLSDQDPPFEVFLLPGVYDVAEAVPMDWMLESADCTQGSADNIDLSAGEEITCTFVNTTTAQSGVLFSKAFVPDTIGPGSTTALTFLIDNSTNAAPADLLTFTDTLPADLTIADPASAVTDCGGSAILDAPAGGSTIGLTFGRVGAFETCTVSVNVASSTPGEGPFTNVSGDLTSSTGNSGPATDDLTVEGGRPGFSKEFVPSSIPLLGTSRLIFTVDNTANAGPAFGLLFEDLLPAGLEIASPANTFTDCPGGVVSVISSQEGGGDPVANGISFTAISPTPLAAGSSCTVAVDVTATLNGTFFNTSSDLLSEAAFTNDPMRSSGFATASLDVPVEFLVKSFLDDPVAPGGTVDLRFIVTNLDRDFPATSIAFTDDLDPLGSLTGLAPGGPLPSEPCGVGSSLAFVAGTGELSLTGGSLGPGDSCQFDVELLVPAGASAGTFTNTTGAITATIDGEGVVGNMATDQLVVDLVPTVTKEFTDDPAPAGGTVTLEFTLTNTSSLTATSDIAFDDDLETALPGLAANSLVAGNNDDPIFDVCGDGSRITVFNPPDIIIGMIVIITPPDPTILVFDGGSLAPAAMPGDSCTFEVELDIPAGTPAGVYTNTTGDVTGLLDFFEAPFTAPGVSGDLEILGAPTLRKEFIDDPAAPSGTTTLQFTLSHDEAAPGDATAIAFTDDLAALDPAIAGLAAVGLPLTEACDPDGPGGDPGTGTLSGTSLLDFSGGVLAPGEECTFSVTLSVPTAAGPGAHTNTTSAVTATVDGVAGVSGNPAEDDLRIDGLELTKAFLDDPVIPGELVTLEFVIENVHPTLTATAITIRDDMATILGGSPDITALDGSTVTDVCGPGNGTVEWSAGDTFMLFSGGTLAPGEMCTFSVLLDVPFGAASGTYVNTTGDEGVPGFEADMPTPIAFDEATDVLVVDNVFLLFTKEFTDDPVPPGGTATLVFTITNLDPDDPIEGIAFTDDLEGALEGLEATGAPTNTCGGMAAGFPTGLFDYAGGSLAGGASCTIELTLSVPSLPVGTQAFNQTSQITGVLFGEGPTVVGDPATDTLRLGFLTLEKAFDGPVQAGDSVDLTFTLTNLGTTAADMLGFTDDLESVVPGLVASGLPFAACGGTVTTFDGGSTIVFVDGSLAAAGSAGDSCMFTVSLDVPSEASFGTFTNTTSALAQGGLDVGDPAEDDLVIEPPIDFSKVFWPDTIGPGSTTQLEFTIANLDSGALAEQVTFTDVLPPGVVIATPSSAFTDCTDGVLSAPDGGTTISLTGARLGLGATCTVTVNVTAAAPGEYDNVSDELTSTAGSGGFAEATLIVDADLPGFSKSFSPATIPPGGTSTLTFLVDLSAAGRGSDVGNLDFTDILPAGLIIATPSNAATDCESTSGPAFLLADPGTGVITLSAVGFLPSSPVLAAGETCTVTVDVTAAGDDLYENVSSELTTQPIFAGSVGFATAELDVRVGFLVKSFTDDPVPPGSAVTLEFTINNPSRDFEATDIEFTDDLDAVLPGTPDLTVSGALPTDPCGAGSTLTVEPVNVLTLAGGNLPAAGSCTFSVTLTVPVGAATGIHTNTTSSISATIDGATETGDPASDDLRVIAFPILVKEFLDAATLDPDPVVGAGDDVVIRFTITNTSTTSAATDVEFFDELTAFLPFPITAVLPGADPCGAGSSVTLDSCGADCQGLSLNDGLLSAAGMAGDSCSFDVTLTLPTGLGTGTYVNTTDEITAMVDGAPVTGLPATDTFDLVAAPRLTKEFTTDPVQPGGMVTLEFTLEHDPSAPGDAVDVEFTDDLAAALAGLAAAAGQLPLADVCGPGNGDLVGTAGDTLLTFSGATLAPGEICTFSVDLLVPVDAPAGIHTNTTSNVVATVLGVETTELPAEDDLTVGGLILTKSFVDDPVIAGGTVMLEFTLTNLSPDPISDIFFEDLLDPDVLEGLTVVTPMPLVDPCGTGSLLEIFSAPEIPFPPTPAIDEALRFSGGSLDAPTGMEGDDSCTFSVELMVPAATPSGNYVNRTRDLEGVIDSTTLPFPNAQDDLVVATGQLLLTKEFIDDPVIPGGQVTLEFTIATLGAFDEASDLAFSDDLDAALAGLEGVPPYDTGSCGGTLTGTSLLDFSGGSLTGGECSFTLTVQVPAPLPIGTTAVNTTSSLTGTIEGLAVTGEPASDELLINSFEFTKEFDGPSSPGGTPILTFTIVNLSPTASVTDLSFADDLNLIGFPGLEAIGLPAEPCGIGSSISGTSVLIMTGGNLLPGGSCTFSVDLLVPLGIPGGDYLNETGDLEILGVPVALPATAILEINSPPLFVKSFEPDMIVEGVPTRLIFTIDNGVNDIPATDLAFTDVLPAPLFVAPDPAVFNDCGGTVSAPAGGTTIDLSGGSVELGEACTVAVNVVALSVGTFVNVSGDLTSSSGNSGQATDTLVIGVCMAADGIDLILGPGVVLVPEFYEACNTIELQQHYLVLGPNGELVLRAGVAVILHNGVEFGPDSFVDIGLDPSLTVP